MMSFIVRDIRLFFASLTLASFYFIMLIGCECIVDKLHSRFVSFLRYYKRRKIPTDNKYKRFIKCVVPFLI